MSQRRRIGAKSERVMEKREGCGVEWYSGDWRGCQPQKATWAGTCGSADARGTATDRFSSHRHGPQGGPEGGRAPSTRSHKSRKSFQREEAGGPPYHRHASASAGRSSPGRSPTPPSPARFSGAVPRVDAGRRNSLRRESPLVSALWMASEGARNRGRERLAGAAQNSGSTPAQPPANHSG